MAEADPSPIDPEVRAHIDARLAAVEAECGVRILFAAESGSRAWGFPSPDSDYDVRFVYAHPVEWYLSLVEGRDVIEKGIDDRDVDLGGWDIRKALRLLLKSNAVLHEWLSSPIVYRDDGRLAAAVRPLFERLANPRALAFHYREIARGQWKRALEGRESVKLKRYFYAVRPLLALDWVAARGTPPPMHIDALLTASVLPPAAAAEFERLLADKRTTPELGEGPRRPALDVWILERLTREPELSAAASAARPGAVPPSALAEADAAFRRLIGHAVG